MPSQDTWTAGSGGKPGTYSGRIRSWVNTPNFGSLPKDSKPVNSYDDWVMRTQVEPVTAYYYPSSNPLARTYVYNNTIWATPQETVSKLSNMIAYSNFVAKANAGSNSAKLKALGRIADAKVNVAVAYAEASKTSDLILGTARRIDRAYRAFRRGNLGEVARQLNITPKRLHKSWLEYKYGWMPLLMDVKGSAEFFAQQAVGRPPRFIVDVHEKLDLSTTRVTSFTPWGGGAAAQYTETIVSTNNVHVKLWCEITNPHASQLQQIGLTNPALIAWELIPFSFVFDWFISVGSWLEGITALNGVTVRRGLVSNVLTHAFTYDCPGTTRTSGGTVFVNGHYVSRATNRHYGRSAYVPNPWELYPPKTKSFSFAKMITSLALIQGNYRGPARL